MQKFYLFLFVFSVHFLSLHSQTSGLKGVISDAKSGELLIGANILVQGTDIGNASDLDGSYLVEKISPGDYNIVFSYTSYKTQIVRVTLVKDEILELNIKLEEESVVLEGVTITATKKTDSEVSMINTIKMSNLVVSGVSSQQISKSQDRDASEVVRRIPGVTIRDGRFVIVRGLIERYNSVWLNNASTPSSEADIRAFSFDVIPSNAIDRILIFKTPAPELPADFAGASIQIFTKSNADENRTSFSYNVGYNNQATFNKNYETYTGSKTDWIGFDNGLRNLPANYPTDKNALAKYADNPSETTKQLINTIGKSFNKNWTTFNNATGPNQSLNFSYSKRFVIGKVSVGNLTSLNYSNNNSFFVAKKFAYDGYDVKNEIPYYRHQFEDNRSTNNVRLGALMNWLFIFGKNQKIEFRNILNQSGEKYTNSRSGIDNGSSFYLSQRELFYQSRLTYSGQLSGTHNFNNELTKLDWTIGYSIANRDQPDTRRITSALSLDLEKNQPYSYLFTSDPDPRLFGRLYLENKENIVTTNVNLNKIIQTKGTFLPQVKVGVYAEQKERTFNARNIGFVRSGTPSPDLFTNSIINIFNDANINYQKGIRVAEKTSASDSYDAKNELLAGYLALNLPISKKFNLYSGVRAEFNNQMLNIASSPTPVFKNARTDFFPSLNSTFNFNEKNLLRLAFGRSVNRPEFREIAPFVYYDFEQVANIYGNTKLKNAYVQNLDLRYEWYPSTGETVTFGGFFKSFTNTIEAQMRQFGSDISYEYVNTRSAKSLGAELDVRKSLRSLEDNKSLSFLKNFVLVLNASIIGSQVSTDSPTERDDVRVMQGQSPYIVNTGIYYQDAKNDLNFSVLYNRIGKRIVFIGDLENPHIWEMPRNSLDLTLSKQIGKLLQIKAGVRDIINNKTNWVQYFDFQKNGVSTEKKLDYYSFRPGTVYTLGFSFILNR
ncbi:MAG: TonB-dependent receptor [Bacteroidetes bacterium]|nr:TonB-dependent receptor [Bacteroidota bacterium]